MSQDFDSRKEGFKDLGLCNSKFSDLQPLDNMAIIH